MATFNHDFRRFHHKWEPLTSDIFSDQELFHLSPKKRYPAKPHSDSFYTQMTSMSVEQKFPSLCLTTALQRQAAHVVHRPSAKPPHHGIKASSCSDSHLQRHQRFVRERLHDETHSSAPVRGMCNTPYPGDGLTERRQDDACRSMIGRRVGSVVPAGTAS